MLIIIIKINFKTLNYLNFEFWYHDFSVKSNYLKSMITASTLKTSNRKAKEIQNKQKYKNKRSEWKSMKQSTTERIWF